MSVSSGSLALAALGSSVASISPFVEIPIFDQISPEIVQLVMAVLLGMFLGLEREWSQKSAGIRTFALISLLGAILSIIGESMLLVAGAFLVITMSVLLAVQSLIDSESETSLR